MKIVVISWVVGPLVAILLFFSFDYILFNNVVPYTVYNDTYAYLAIAMIIALLFTKLSKYCEKPIFLGWNVIAILFVIGAAYVGVCARRLDSIAEKKPLSFRIKNTRYYVHATHIVKDKQEELNDTLNYLNRKKQSLRNSTGSAFGKPKSVSKQNSIDKYNRDYKQYRAELSQIKKRIEQLKRMKKVYLKNIKARRNLNKSIDQLFNKVF